MSSMIVCRKSFLPVKGVVWCLFIVVALVGQAPAARRIEMTEFAVEPASLKLGESFVVRARAVATRTTLGSFLLRTAEDVAREDAIPGFPLYISGKYYVEEEGKYFLKDNGALDGDPRDNAFSLEISTRGWKEGVYVLAFFASCRPAPGPFIVARRDFAVVVRGQQVQIEDLGQAGVITGFKALPRTISPGTPVTVSIGLASTGCQGLEITTPCYVTAADALPGFFHDATKKKALYGTPSEPLVTDGSSSDEDPAPGSLVLKLDTRDWPSGVHHLLVNSVGFSDKPIDHRSFAVKIVGAQDHLQVVVEDSCWFAPGTHFGSFLKLRDGTLLCANQFSSDGGRTWQGQTGGFGDGGEPLADGSILGLAYRCLPEEEEDGWYRVVRSLSSDGGRSFEKSSARVFVPEAKAAMGHGPHVGPLFMRSLVQREDGSLVALMAGWFKSDTALCPYGRGRPYSRSYVCESNDKGLTWRYLSTIGYELIGSEGYNEGAMRRLPSGEWLAVLRTGNERDRDCQDNPIMWSVSCDEGRSWSRPERTGVEGAYPCLAVLSDGLLVMSYGRPGAMIVFSADGGRTWTDHTPIDATPYSGYTGVVEIGPGELLVGFGTKDYLDPKSGRRADQLRLVRVRYEQVRP